MKPTILLAACLVALPVFAGEDKSMTKTESVTVTTVIEAIDKEARTLVLKDKTGNYETLYAGPHIKRFDELKVGDKVTFKYSESVAVSIRKPGEPVAASKTSDPVIERGTGAKPSGSMSQQQTGHVTIKAVDPKTSAVTFTTEDGRTMTARVEDKNIVKNVKPGDKVELTYTTALLISVE